MISKHMRNYIDNAVNMRNIFEEGKQLAAVYGAENVFNFAIGNPSVDPPEIVTEALHHAVDIKPAQDVHGYPANVGFPDVRKHIANYLNEKYGTSYDVPGIIMTVGCGTAICCICNALLDIGDEVVTFSPFFWEYRSYVQNYYGKLVTARCNMETLQPDRENFEKALTPKTRFVIMNSPNNPTGAVYTEESLRMISDVLCAKEKEFGHPIYLLSDEPYRALCYEGEVPYTANFYHNTLTAYSYSKELSIPGERIGYIAMQPTIDDFDDMAEGLAASIRYQGIVNAPSLQQKMLLECTGACVDVDIYRQSRDALYNGLTEIGFNCIHPDGAFYLFMQALEDDDQKFCAVARSEFNLLFAPGSAFEGPGWVRIAYCVPKETIERSMPRFRQLYEKYRG